MDFAKHWELKGKHAFLGASKYHWIGYDEDRLSEAFWRYDAAQRGTQLHEFAANAIELKCKLSHSKRTLNMYVNDAIGFRMTPEQPLYYSDNCFGTADAISFRDNMLRIHDLKTGTVVPGHIEQLLIYAALFCLEYDYKPEDISCELRIYQNNEVLVHNPEPVEIRDIMNKIVAFDRVLNRLKTEAR